MKRTPLKRTRLNKQSPKAKLFIEEKIAALHKQSEFFFNIWNKRVHVCQSCGKPLGSEPKSYMFDHLLEKQVYEELRYEEINIFICCLECHTLKTNGHPTQKHLEAINNIKIIYGITI